MKNVPLTIERLRKVQHDQTFVGPVFAGELADLLQELQEDAVKQAQNYGRALGLAEQANNNLHRVVRMLEDFSRVMEKMLDNEVKIRRAMGTENWKALMEWVKQVADFAALKEGEPPKST